ncbi:hypothetical protein [Cellulomonas sp.]|uniref:hypothetical protein n=1 Tax=Cellulomonas sp. TaxID=40001 RepID=UPI00258BF21C|nr:hypothetical protein [Cellulomonas sp.]MCR6689291.1 hypothetical protein [Cellulomonas sp.]
MTPRRPLVDDAAFALGGYLRAMLLFAVLMLTWALASDAGSAAAFVAVTLTLGLLPSFVVGVPVAILLERWRVPEPVRYGAYAVLAALLPAAVLLAMDVQALSGPSGLGAMAGALGGTAAVATVAARWWSVRARRRRVALRAAGGGREPDEAVEDREVDAATG